MMSAADITSNPETQRAPGKNVRQVMLVTRKPRDAHRGRKSVSRDLHRGTILVLMRDDGRHGPRLRAVTRRKRTAAIEELTPLTPVQRTRTFRHALQNIRNDDG